MLRLLPCVHQDLRKTNWVPRREAFTAKKLDEVRAQAEAELGMVSSVLTGERAAMESRAQARREWQGQLDWSPPG